MELSKIAAGGISADGEIMKFSCKSVGVGASTTRVKNLQQNFYNIVGATIGRPYTNSTQNIKTKRIRYPEFTGIRSAFFGYKSQENHIKFRNLDKKASLLLQLARTYDIINL